MSTRSTRQSLDAIATSVATLAARPEGWAELGSTETGGRVFAKPVEQTFHFHADIEPDVAEGLFGNRPEGLDVKAKLAPLLFDPAARVAVLTVARRLKVVADASQPITGSEIRDLGLAYERIQELLNLIGGTTPEEERQADDLIIDLLTPEPK